jgi:hypothetical protein
LIYRFVDIREGATFARVEYETDEVAIEAYKQSFPFGGISMVHEIEREDGRICLRTVYRQEWALGRGA